MRKIAPILLLMSFINITAETAGERHALLTSLMQEYVKGNRVNYRELCKDRRLPQYISELKSEDPYALADRDDQLAFWINAYNAYTLKVICDNYPVKSINELHTGGLYIASALKTTIWDKEIVVIKNKKTTLNNIEHKIIRPEFKDPRIHFAVVCAAKSCPPLRTEAFEGYNLDQQLNEQGSLFLSEESKNRFDAANRTAYISKIFDWYGKDFGKDKKQVLTYLSQFLPDHIRKSIQSDLNRWKIEYTDYDWSLNE